MDQFLHFALLGLGVGALYVLSAQGLVLIYRGSGVLNFAQGALAVFGAYWYYELNQHGVPYGWAVAIAILVTALLGALFHLVVLRALRRASAMMRLVATLALLICIQGIATAKYGSELFTPSSKLPQALVSFGKGVVVTEDRLILLGIACFITLVLYLVYRYTRFGISTSAVAENQLAAAATGLSPNLIATVNWALGSALAAVAGILIAPLTGISVSEMTPIVLAGLAAALLGGFSSFPLTLLGALAIGVVETVLPSYTKQVGLPAAAPLLLIVIVMVIRGRSLPLRGFLLDRLPEAGTGRIKWLGLGFGCAAFVALDLSLNATWTDALGVTFAMALILLSIVVLTGYAGQISLGQWILAGVGAFVAGKLVATQGWPFEVALIAGIAGAALVGSVFALLAVRTRGANLAIITFGLGAVIADMVFNNLAWTGGYEGTNVGYQKFFGIDVDSTLHSSRYALLVFILFVLVALFVANVRRGRFGLRMLAVRTNERAAAALGISVPGTKLFAFSLAAGIAGLGGALFAFQSTIIPYSTIFESALSITLVGYVVIGSVGWLAGSVLGATLASGALGAQILQQIWPGSVNYTTLISGIALVLIIMTNPDGIAHDLAHKKEGAQRLGAGVLRRLGMGSIVDRMGSLAARTDSRRRGVVIPPLSAASLPDELPRASRQASLEVSGLTVKYGAVTAVNDVSLSIGPGEIVGLIGPNGAGKSTFIDAVTGFTPLAGGKVSFDGHDVSSWSVRRRARAGLMRSFQGLELFDDMTILDNLRVASEPPDALSGLTELVRPRRAALSQTAIAAVHEFGLLDHLEEQVESVSYGTRRLVGVARAVSGEPSILMLDEPAAGLSESETEEFAQIVRELADKRGMGILLVEHDVKFVLGLCDRISVLDFGSCICEGSPEEVRNDARVRAAYLGEPEEDDRQPADVIPDTDSQAV